MDPTTGWIDRKGATSFDLSVPPFPRKQTEALGRFIRQKSYGKKDEGASVAACAEVLLLDFHTRVGVDDAEIDHLHEVQQSFV